MQKASVWAQLLGVQRTVVEKVEFDDGKDVVVCHFRPVRAERVGVGSAGGGVPAMTAVRAAGAGGRWIWDGRARTARPKRRGSAAPPRGRGRGGSLGTAPRRAHPVLRRSGGVAGGHLLAAAVFQLMRIAWRSVDAIVRRVSADVDAVTDRFAGLRRIGIDEISYKKGHKYLTIVADHDSGLLVWAAEGHDPKTLGKFFTALERQRNRKCRTGPVPIEQGDPRRER